MDLALLFKDKDILVIGNSEHSREEERPEADLVCNFNMGVDSRTDIWVHCLINNQEEAYANFNGQAIIVPNPRNRKYVVHFNKPTYIEETDILTKLKLELGHKPSCGLMFVHLLLRVNTHKSIKLIGFDHFKTKTFYNEHKTKRHDHKTEKQYFDNLRQRGLIL